MCDDSSASGRRLLRGGPAMASVTGIALGVNKDKRLELLAITGRGSAAPSGGVWRAHQTAPNGAWSGWESLGLPDNSAVSANAPAVA